MTPPTARPPLRIAFVQHQDAQKVRSWSGTLFFSKAALSRHVGVVEDLTPFPFSLLPFRIARQLIRRTTGKWYSYEHDPVLARWFGRYFSKRVADVKPDLVFAPAASAAISFLETDAPIVYYSDATWRVMEGYHKGLSNLIRRSSVTGDDLERRAISRSALALFSSDWAADSAVRDYGAAQEKVSTVYIGANLPHPPEREEVLPRRLGPVLRLLMVGVSWEDKGGPVAFETLLRLLERGIDAELRVVGCVPPRGVSHPRLTVVPYLNKSDPVQKARFERFWMEADVFILPTRFDAAGIVFCEAGAYALPILAPRTGGVPSLVRDGVNGFTLPPDADGDAYADLIARLVEDPGEYERLCEASRTEFETRLNWDAWGRRVAGLIEERVPGMGGRTLAGRSERSDRPAASPEGPAGMVL